MSTPMPTTMPATIEPSNLAQWREAPHPPRVIDVRTPSEFTTSHIPGSYNVPLDLLQEHRDELVKHLDDDVVLVCRSGARATEAEQALTKVSAALPNLHVLAGGMTAWENAGGEVNRGEQRWELERQVRLVAGSIVLGSVLASTAAPRLKWVAAAIGAGLSGAAVTNTCAMGKALSALPYNRKGSPTIEQVLDRLTDPESAH